MAGKSPAWSVPEGKEAFEDVKRSGRRGEKSRAPFGSFVTCITASMDSLQ